MDTWVYEMQIVKGENYRRMTGAVVERHVENLRRLDAEGRLVFCGVYKGYKGVAGMLLLRAESLEAAKALCQREPLVAEGFAAYTLHALEVANRENDFLL